MLFLELDNPKNGLQKQTVYQMNPLDKRNWMLQVSTSYLLKQCDSLRIKISAYWDQNQGFACKWNNRRGPHCVPQIKLFCNFSFLKTGMDSCKQDDLKWIIIFFKCLSYEGKTKNAGISREKGKMGKLRLLIS